jgi:hypothetical protein
VTEASVPAKYAIVDEIEDPQTRDRYFRADSQGSEVVGLVRFQRLGTHPVR